MVMYSLSLVPTKKRRNSNTNCQTEIINLIFPCVCFFLPEFLAEQVYRPESSFDRLFVTRLVLSTRSSLWIWLFKAVNRRSFLNHCISLYGGFESISQVKANEVACTRRFKLPFWSRSFKIGLSFIYNRTNDEKSKYRKKN